MTMTLHTLGSEIRKEWLEHILPFWGGLKDETNGGFYGQVNADLKIDEQAAKGGIACSRILWSFSAAYRTTGHEIYAEYARHAFQFLARHLIDRQYGGLYWMVDYKGVPTDTRKHIYNQAFAVYALSEYHRASGNQEALDLAKDLYRLIESKGYDAKRQAYKEEFDREWNEQPNEMLSGNGVVAHITMNTHIHVLEAYSTLYRAWPEAVVRESLHNLLSILYHHIFDADRRRLGVFFDKDWNPLVDVTSFGHDIEASWLMDEALDVIGSTNPDYKRMVLDLAYAVSERAVQQDGSLMNEQEGSHLDTSRIWWVQAEAMVGFFNAYQRTGDIQFLEQVFRMWNYTKKNIIDSRPGSEWFWSVNENGRPDQHEMAGPWKCPYHNSRFCLEILNRIEHVSSKL